MGFCDSSDFSSLGVSADDFAVFFCDLSTPLRLDNKGLSFGHVDGDEPLSCRFYAHHLECYWF
jgi:hypothetical protein